MIALVTSQHPHVQYRVISSVKTVKCCAHQKHRAEIVQLALIHSQKAQISLHGAKKNAIQTSKRTAKVLDADKTLGKVPYLNTNA
jgi:hypothetical protein